MVSFENSLHEHVFANHAFIVICGFGVCFVYAHFLHTLCQHSYNKMGAVCEAGGLISTFLKKEEEKKKMLPEISCFKKLERKRKGLKTDSLPANNFKNIMGKKKPLSSFFS